MRIGQQILAGICPNDSKAMASDGKNGFACTCGFVAREVSVLSWRRLLENP